MNEKTQNWTEEWKDMPEYVQQNQMPAQSIKINFANKEDVQKFAELIEQKITNKTKSCWYPKQNLIKPSDYLYIDES